MPYNSIARQELTCFKTSVIINKGSRHQVLRGCLSWQNRLNYYLVYFENILIWSSMVHIHTNGNITWWRNQIETFPVLLALCEGNSPVTGEFPSQRPVVQSFDVFFDLRLNKELSKQSRQRWLENPSRPLWRHCNDTLSCMCQWPSSLLVQVLPPTQSDKLLSEPTITYQLQRN